MHLRLITGPTAEPITLDDAKQQCRVDGEHDDVYITSLVMAARTYIETVTRRALLTQTWEMVLDYWPWTQGVLMTKPPLQSIVSVKYTNAANAVQTWNSANYFAATASEPGRLFRAKSVSWPVDELWPAEAIVIRYVCGWGNPEDVPEPIKQAMRLLIAHWYENREAVMISPGLTGGVSVPMGFDALLATYRVRVF